MSTPTGQGRPVVLITGGATGIGKALAGEFARHGHDLMLVSRTKEDLVTAAHDLSAETGAKVEFLVADLTSDSERDKVEDALNARGLYTDILVNNAGLGLAGGFCRHDPAEIEQLLLLNVNALTALTRKLLPGMLARGRGGVLHVGSLGGLVPGPYQAVYYASKAYVTSLTHALKWEVLGSGVRMSALLPGPVATRFHDLMGAEQSAYLKVMGAMPAKAVARAGYRGYMRRQTLIIPGLFNNLTAIALKFIPHTLLTPLLGWMLKRRLK